MFPSVYNQLKLRIVVSLISAEAAGPLTQSPLCFYRSQEGTNQKQAPERGLCICLVHCDLCRSNFYTRHLTLKAKRPPCLSVSHLSPLVCLSSGVPGWWSPSLWPRCCPSACWFTSCRPVAARWRFTSPNVETTRTSRWTTSTEPLHEPEEAPGNQGKGLSHWTTRTLRMKSGRRRGRCSCQEDQRRRVWTLCHCTKRSSWVLMDRLSETLFI